MVFRVFLASVTALSISLISFGQTQAGVSVKERTKHYNVSGKTGEKLWKSIDRRGPKVRRVHAVATTTSRIRLRKAKAVTDGSRCRFSRVNVDVSLTYRYPRWLERRSAKAKARKAWDGFYQQLIRHEKAHGKIEKDYAQKAHQAVLKAEGRKSRNCSDLNRNLNRKLAALRKQANRAHQRLDRRDGYRSSRIRRLQRQTKKIQ